MLDLMNSKGALKKCQSFASLTEDSFVTYNGRDNPCKYLEA